MPRIYPDHKQRFEDEKKQIRQFLKTRIKGVKVSQGRGTAAAWVNIKAPGGLSVAEADGLMAMGVIARPGDKYIGVSPQDTHKFVNKINMVSSSSRLSDRISKTRSAQAKPKYEIQQKIGGSWKNESTETTPDGKETPLTFSSKSAAEAEIKDLVSMMDYNPADYRVRQVGGVVKPNPKRQAPTIGNIVDGKQFGFGGKRKNRFN